MAKEGGKPIRTTMGKGISTVNPPNRSMVEKKYPLKKSSHGETDTIKPRPPKH